MLNLVTKKPKRLMLTVEESDKWHDIYAINEHGDTRAIIESYTFGEINAIIYKNWMKDCITPAAFIRIASILGAQVDEATYKAVVERFIQNHLGGNSKKLLHYNPEPELFKSVYIANIENNAKEQEEMRSSEHGCHCNNYTQEELATIFRFALSNAIFQTTNNGREEAASLIKKTWELLDFEQRLKIIAQDGSVEQLAFYGIDIGKELSLAEALGCIGEAVEEE